MLEEAKGDVRYDLDHLGQGHSQGVNVTVIWPVAPLWID